VRRILDSRRVRKATTTVAGVAKPANARVVARHARAWRQAEPWSHHVERAGVTYRELIDRSLEWLARAQDASGSGGVACYEFGGWTSGYPEVTGYIIPTVFDCSRLLDRPDLAERAVRMAGWELRVQKPEGGFESFYEGDGRPPVVFNTGQALRGLLRAHEETGDGRFLDAARRAADWIVERQEPDGSWSAANYLGMKRVYDTYVAAPLAAFGAATNSPRYTEAAVRNCEFALAHQRPNGWFDLCDNTPSGNAAPVTHTIGYTVDGLLETGRLTEREDFLAAAGRAAGALAEAVSPSGWLPARLDEEWRPAAGYVSLSGSAQIGIVLMHESFGGQYREVAERLVDFLAYVQDLSAVGADRSGGLPGSYPVWGRYVPLKYPSWATKYFLDLLVAFVRAEPHDSVA